MPFVEGGIVADLQPQQTGFIEGGIVADPTPEDSYNKVLQFESAQTDFVPTKQEFLDYYKVSKTKPLLGEKPMATMGEAFTQTVGDIVDIPFKTGQAIGQYFKPPEGVESSDVAAGTGAEIAVQSKLKAERMGRGLLDTALNRLSDLTGKLRNDDDKYEAFLAAAEIKRQLARAAAPEDQRVPASQEVLQAYGIPQEAISQPGVDVGGFAADPSSIAFAGGGKLASMALQRGAAQIPRISAALQRGGERVSAAARMPEELAGRATAAVTGSESLGQAAQNAMATGTAGIAIGEAAGLPISSSLNVPGIGTASRIIGGAKALGGSMETIGEAGAVSGGPSLSPIQRGLLGAGERIAAAPGASSAARSLGTAIARSGLEAPAKTAAQMLIPMAGAGAAGGLLAGLTGEEGDAVAAAIGSGAGFGMFDAGFRLAKASSSGALDGGRVRRAAVDDLNTRPTDVQFTYVDPVQGEQTVTIKDANARAKLYANLDSKQLTKALSEVAGAENAGVDVIFHDNADVLPDTLQSVNYAGVSIGPDNIKSGRPTILINVDKATPEALPHEILHARITQDVVSQLGAKAIDTAAADPNFRTQFTDFANKYADKLQSRGGRVVADRIRSELRDAFDPSLERAQQVGSLKRIVDEFAAYYTQEFLKGKDPKTMLPGRIPSFIEVAVNNAKEAVSERFTRRALQAGFDPVARSFYDANGKRIRIPWMEDAIRNLVTPKEGYEPTEQRIDTRKMTKAQQNALIMARGYSDLFMTAPDGSIVRPLSKAELAAKTADVAKRTMRVVESVPQSERTSVSVIDANGNQGIEGRLSLREADALSQSGIFSPSTSRFIIDIAKSINDGTLMEGKYWKVYGPTGKAGVFGEANKLFLPYGISINSKGGVNVKVVDWGKVQARMYKALSKPAYRNLFSNYDQAMTSLKDVYLKNIADRNAVPSADVLGGGIDGVRKRNLFNEVMGAVPKKGDTMVNAPTAGYVADRKGGSVYQDLRIERIQSADPTGTMIPWTGDMGEQSSYRRTQLNFQPAERIGPETEAFSDRNAGYRILSKGGKFRLYGPDGSTVGIFDTQEQAKLKAEKDYATQARLQPEIDQQQRLPRDEGGQAAEAGRGNRAVGRQEGQGQVGTVRQEGDVNARFMAAVEADPTQPSTETIKGIRADRGVNSLYQFDYTYKIKSPGKPAKENTATETVSAFSLSEAKDKARKAITKELADKKGILKSSISIDQPTIKGQFAFTELSGKNRDTTAPKIVLNPNNAQQFRSMFEAVDAALEMVKDSPTMGLDSDGWVKAFSRSLNGSKSSVPPAPLRLAQWVQDNNAFRSFIEDGLRRNPELIKSAVGGLNALQPIHEMARNGMIHPKMVALHMFWGLLSRMLDPYNQEAGWARLTSDPKVVRLIEDSVAGRYNLSKDAWKGIVSDKMSEFPDVKVGRNAIQNANAFHEMLSRWNGRWVELADIINNPNLDGPNMRRQFNEKGFGGAGIKHKVLSFVIATLARNDVFVGDRWQVVNLWFPHLEKAAAARKAAGGSGEVFAYDKNGVPEDTTGAYKVIGGMLNNETVAETAYSLIENGMRKIAADSPWLRDMLGREPQPFDIHWLTWNIIKNEPVGHSSLDATAKFLTENLYGDPAFAERFAETEKRTEKYTKGGFDVFSVKGQERPQMGRRTGTEYGGPGASGLGPDAGRGQGGLAGPGSGGQTGKASGAEVASQRYMPSAAEMATGRGVLDRREAQALWDQGYRIYGAPYDGAESPVRLRKVTEIDLYDPENLWALPPKGKVPEGMRNMPADADYLAAVKAGDTAAVQRMVDEAAKAAGFTQAFKGISEGGGIEKLGSRGGWFSDTMQGAKPYGSVVRAFIDKGGIWDFRSPDHVAAVVGVLGESFIPKGMGGYGVSLRSGLARGAFPFIEDPSVLEAIKGIGFTGITTSEGDGAHFAVFNPEQIKSADPITLDDAGNVIPLSKRFQMDSPDIRYMPTPDSSMPGAMSFPGGFRAIPGKAKGSLRLYGPAGALIGIAANLDEARRIVARRAAR